MAETPRLTPQELENALLPIAHTWRQICKQLQLSEEEVKKLQGNDDSIADEKVLKRLIDQQYPILSEAHMLKRILSTPSRAEFIVEYTAPTTSGPSGFHKKLAVPTPIPLQARYEFMHPEPKRIKLEREQEQTWAGGSVLFRDQELFSSLLSDAMQSIRDSNLHVPELLAILESYDSKYSTLTIDCRNINDIIQVLENNISFRDYPILEFIATETNDLNLLQRVSTYSSSLLQEVVPRRKRLYAQV